MGLFDGIFKFLKKGNYQKPIKNIEKSENKSNEPIVTTIYCYGHLFRIYPIPSWPYSDHIDLICKSNIIVSEDIRYDLTSKESIQSIAIPSYEIHGANKIDKDLGIASSLEFALRMKGDEYWKDKIFDLAIACYEKATQLMAVSDEAWEEEDFFLVVNRLKELGQIERAKKWEEWLEQNIYASDIVKEIEQELIREKSEDELLVFYDCGHIVKILPEPTFEKGYYEILDRIRAVKNIISDGEKYDLTDIDSIYSIDVQRYSPPENDYKLSITGTLEYLLMEKAKNCTKDALGIAYLRKAVELMKKSDVNWSRQDFQLVVWRFNDFGANEDALKLEKWYKANILTDEQEAELIAAGKLNKELSYVQKEIIAVKKITTEDMTQFSGMPYQLNHPIQKIIKHGAHPLAYIDLDEFNQGVATKELERLDSIIINARSYIPQLTKEYHIDIKKVEFCEYDSSYGYTRLICNPYTFTGKISKHPLSLLFMSRQDIRTYSVIGELFYDASGNLDQATASIWKAPKNHSKPGTGWLFTFGIENSELVITKATSTLSPDEDGKPGIVYRCQSLISKENEKELNRIIFKWLQKNLPDDCPKSISGFQRMRNANSKNYQALVAKAEAAGFVFPTSLEEVTPWEGID